MEVEPLLFRLQFLSIGQQLLDDLGLPGHGEPVGRLEVHPEQLQSIIFDESHLLNTGCSIKSVLRT